MTEAADRPDKKAGFPWWTIPLIALASIRFEYNTESGSQLQFDGMRTFLLVLTIVAISLLIGIIKKGQRVLLVRGLISQIPQSRFWMALPLVVFLPAIGYRSVSGLLSPDDPNQPYHYQWDFQWGAHPLHIWFIVVTIILLILHTTSLTIKEMERTALQKD